MHLNCAAAAQPHAKENKDSGHAPEQKKVKENEGRGREVGKVQGQRLFEIGQKTRSHVTAKFLAL